MTSPGSATSGLAELIRSDLAANRGNLKGRVVMVLFRLAHAARGTGRSPLWAAPVIAVYRLLVEWTIGVELPPKLRVGPGLAVWHGVGLVVNADTIIGSGVTLRQGTTIGALDDGSDRGSIAPVIGNDVNIGVGALVIGPITIGDGAIIGAGAVVIDDVPAGATVVGNPARVLEAR